MEKEEKMKEEVTEIDSRYFEDCFKTATETFYKCGGKTTVPITPENFPEVIQGLLVRLQAVEAINLQLRNTLKALL